jgi:DnaJ-class molecular chaperone
MSDDELAWCPRCNGTGRIPKKLWVVCPKCAGTSFIRDDCLDDYQKSTVPKWKCPRCKEVIGREEMIEEAKV